MSRFAARRDRAPVDTLYFGGGTPSRLGGDGVAALRSSALRGASRWRRGAEVTIEANPEDVTADAVARVARGRRQPAVARRPDASTTAVLAWMHRMHDVARHRPRGRRGRAPAGIDERLARPHLRRCRQALDRDWDARPRRASLALEPTHVSLYGLTVEPGTPLGRWRARGRGRARPTRSATSASSCARTSALAAAGFEHYEVSNFARPGRRVAAQLRLLARACRTSGSGPSAHGFDGRDAALERRAPTPTGCDARRARATIRVEGERGARRREPRSRSGLSRAAHRSTGSRSRRDERRDRRAVDRRRVGASRRGRAPAAARRSGWLRLDALAADLTLIRSRS